MNDFWFKCDKISGFLVGCLLKKMSLDEAWYLMLNSEQGRGILNNEYYYVYRLQGRTSAYKAIEASEVKFKKHRISYDLNIEKFNLLAAFIEDVHTKLNIPYEDIFKKMSIDKFFKKFGDFLGNYDLKLARNFLL